MATTSSLFEHEYGFYGVIYFVGTVGIEMIKT